MAITINNTPKVALSGPVGASVSTNAPAAAFGSLQADATLRTGAALEKSLQSVADAFAVRDETDNLRIAKDLEREYVDYSNLLMYGDGTTENIGYMNLKGQLAVDAGVDAAASLAEYQAATLAQYEDNTRVTELYTDSTSTRIDGSNIQIMGHTAVQRNVVTVGASDAYKEMSVTESLADPMNSDLTDRTIAAIAAENAEMAFLSGISAQELATQNQTEQSAYLLTLVETAANDNPDNALILLAENVDVMSAVDADKAEAAIAAAASTAATADSAARKEAIAIQEAKWDVGNSAMQLTVANGTFDEAYWLQQSNLGFIKPSDYLSTKDYVAKGNTSSPEASAQALGDYTKRVYAGEDTAMLRQMAAEDPSLMGDDHRTFMTWSTGIDDQGGTWMTSAAAQQALKDVVLAVSPGGFEALMANDSEGILRKNEAQDRVSALIKDGMSPTDATARVIMEFARDKPLATSHVLMSLALPLGLGGPDFTAPLRPTLGASDVAVQAYENQLASFQTATASEWAYFLEQNADGAYTSAEVDRLTDQFEDVKAWTETAISELSLSVGPVEDVPVAE